MEAAQDRLDIATQNLANVSTIGYRRREARGFLTARGALIRSAVSGEHGPIERTGRTYDLAIAGDGAFRVRAASGRVALTRAGAFSRDAHGSLRDARGRTLVDPHDRPIRIADGAVPTGAQIGLPAESSLQSGALEAGSVNAIDEMVTVLTAQRAYEGAQKIASEIDETRKQSADAARVK
jgi:flagellar basal body rod protein FlgG